jgi:hypothetical protein
MLKVIIAIAAVVLSAEIVAISFAPGAEIPATTAAPMRASKGDRLDVRPVTPVNKTEPKAQKYQVRQTRLA